ncbi:MAG: PorP/SprF family type IX secretion system membrane protein [Saprospiraceae bacterium]|nr:PorP/SprF family type IX secretion system membrane protein [Saprospiraceae bacterium]
MKELLTSLRFFLIVFALLPATLTQGQDIHFSQFGNSPLNLNPGLAGVFGGDLRFVGNYRSQWRSVPVPYTTFSGSVENKVYLTKGRYDRFLTGSLLVNYDRQGSLHLTSLQIGIPLALTLPIAKTNFLTLGATPAFGQRAFDQSKINFGNQWDGCAFDGSINPNEDLLLQNTSLKYFDLSAGMNFRMQGLTKRNRLDVGAAMHHINRPYHDFWSSTLSDPGNVRLYNKLSVYGLGLVQIRSNFDLMLQASYQKQGGYSEIVYGGGLRFHLNQRPYRELSLQVGADYRSRYQDALIPHVEVLYRTWMLGVTYDVNFWSDVNLVTNRRGGPEISLTYRLYKIKPLPVFKSCPII